MFLTEKKTQKLKIVTLSLVLVAASVLFFSVPPVYADSVSISAIRANEVWSPPPTGMGINGAGVTVAVIDSGINYNHPDSQGAILHHFIYDNLSDDARDTDGHGTRVAGIMAGRGVVNPSYRGIACGANLSVLEKHVSNNAIPRILKLSVNIENLQESGI